MDETTRTPSKRRALLERSALLIGGAIGLGAVARTEGGDVPPESPLRLLGRRRSRAGAAYGDLTLETGGPTVGTFHSNGLGQSAPLHGLEAAPPLELQTFTLKDGTLFGLGAKGRDGERTCAVLGGTGRFAAASGTYVERPATGADVARGAVEFVFTLKA